MTPQMRTTTLVLAAIGIAAGIVTALLYTHDPSRVAVAMCAAWWLGLTIAIGALGALMTLHVAHATWFVVFRPIATAVAGAMPILALGLLPAALVAHHVYPWAGADQGIPLEIMERIERTRPWMSPWPLYLRTLLSLGIWSTLAIVLHVTTTGARARRISGVGLPLLAVTATVTPFDWMMSVEPGYTSTIYGMYVVISGFYAAMALVAVLAWLAVRRGQLGAEVRPDHFHALGRLMLTAVCLWGYLGFFQLMLQWIGNLPSEAAFWTRRASGPWSIASALLLVGHFVVPFFLLLSRPLKRRPGPLAAVGALMLVMHVVDIAWLVVPSRTAGLFASALPPAIAVLALGAAWGLRRFAAHAHAPTTDPDFAAGTRYESP